MNYSHAFHAGNFADVMKHIIVTRLIEYLKKKDAAFRVIDTHAGIGQYDLTGAIAKRSPEWVDGIGKVLKGGLPQKAQALVEPYLKVIAELNPGDKLETYPGSPLLVRKLFRPQDRLSALELHPEYAERLGKLFEGDVQVRVIHLDGWLSLNAHVPPKEKRGLVLVDPPFELEGEFERLVDGLVRAHRRWPGGIYALWYPVKDRAAVGRFRASLANAAVPKILDISFDLRSPSSEPRLDGTGMVVVNPPFTLEKELRIVLPALKSVLTEDKGAGWRLEWLSSEDGGA